MESLFSMNEPPAGSNTGGRVTSNSTGWPLLPDEARMEKLRTMLFHDQDQLQSQGHAHAHIHAHAHVQEVGAESQSNTNNSNGASSAGPSELVHLHENHQLVLMPSEPPEVVQQQQQHVQQPQPQQHVTDGEQRVMNVCATPSRYESQKRRDWNTFRLYLKNHRLDLPHCSGAHVLEFLRYLDQFGKTKVHINSCNFFGIPIPPHPCRCPLRQAWGSLDALIGRLRAAFEEHGGKPESNPFGARMVRLYLREVRETQAKARGVAYGKKKRKCSPSRPGAIGGAAAASPHDPNAGNLGPTLKSTEDHLHQHHHHHHHHHHQQQQQQHLLQQQTSPDHSVSSQMTTLGVPPAAPSQGYEQATGQPSPFEMPEYKPATTLPPAAGGPDPTHPLNAYSPNSNPLIKPAVMSTTNLRAPLSFHSFLDDLPGRRPEQGHAPGWALGTVYNR